MPINRFIALYNAHHQEDQQQQQRQLAATEAAAAAAGDATPHPALAAAMPRPGPDGLPAPAASDLERPAASGAAAGAAATASAGAPSRHSGSLCDSNVREWLQLANRQRIGPRLADLREQQRRAGLPVERYGMAHVYQLGSAQRAWVSEPREWCKDVHRKRDRDGRPIRCTQCTTCHWCRQKSPNVKTQCSACHGNRDNVYGGPMAGVICGNCLWMRFGENLHEARRDPNWLCPACRQICNCSANNCVRNKNGWIPTHQIISEAEALGYQSAAHYLVLSQLDESLLANITDNIHTLAPALDREVAAARAATKRKRSEQDATTSLHEAAEAMVVRELAAVHAATGFTAERAHAVASYNKALGEELGFGRGTLLADLQEDEEDDEDDLVPSPAAAGSGRAAGAQAALSLGSAGSFMEGQGERALRQVALVPWHLPPRQPGRPPPAQARAPSAAASVPAAVGQSQGAVAAQALPQEAVAAQALRAGNRQPASAGAIALGLPAPPATSAGGLGSAAAGRLTGTGTGGTGGTAAAAAAALDAVDSTAGAVVGGASVGGDAEGRQQQLEGLLHQDSDAAFPVGLADDDGPAPGVALGYRPSFGSAAASRAQAQPRAQQPGVAALAASLPVRPQQHQHRLTPIVAPGNKQQRVSVDPAAASGQMQHGAQEAGMAHERGREGSSSPMQAAEPSQQLGLSPGAGEQEAMAASAGGQPEAAGSLEPPADPSLAIVAAAAPTPAPATTPAPLLHGVAAAAPEAQRAPRLLSGMAAEWQDLLDWAAELVRELEATDRLHPTFRPNPYLPAEEEQDAHYEDVYNHNMAGLADILQEANRRLAVPLVATRTEDGMGGSNWLAPDAVGPMVGLYLLLASVLPEDDVKWQVVPRLLSHDCFVDYTHSDWGVRMVLVDAMISLLGTLRDRGMSVQQTCHAISKAVVMLAEDMHSVTELLSSMLEVLQGGNALAQLPSVDVRIGCYVYDTEERGKDIKRSYARLYSTFHVVKDVLSICLARCVVAAGVLKHDAGHLLTPHLARVLLGAEHSIPVDVKRAGLLLVTTVLSYASVVHEQGQQMQLSVDELNQRRDERLRVCQIVKEVVPLLEEVVATKYPLWRSAAATVGRPRVDSGAEASTGLQSGAGAASGERLGDEGVTTLARAYAFLVECGQMTWQALEVAVLRPYTSGTFWQLANRMYRCFGMALMAQTLQHVPSIPTDNRASMLRHWLLCLLDRGRRFTIGAQLTAALSHQAQLAPLFAGMPEQQLAIGADSSGEQAASLLGEVFGRLAADNAARPQPQQFQELLGGLDELLERRGKEATGSPVHAWRDRLRYGARVYRLLAAILPPLVQSPRLPALAVDQLRRLTQHMATLAAASLVAMQQEFSSRRAAEGLGVGGAPPAEHEDEPGLRLSNKADVRQQLQGLPFGQLGSLWGVLLAWGAPNACRHNPKLLEAVGLVVCCTLDSCSGEEQPTAFDEAALERLADSLLPQPLEQLRQFVLGTFVRRSLGRSRVPHIAAERTAVNAVRLLKELLASMRSAEEVQAALLPLLYALLDVLQQPSLAAKEAIHSMLAWLLEQGGLQPSPLAQLLPPFTLPPAAVLHAKALHSFWTVSAADALLCCKQPVVACLETNPGKRKEVQDALQGLSAEPCLRPLDMEPAAAGATNTVSGLSSQLARVYFGIDVETLCQRLATQLDLQRRETGQRWQQQQQQQGVGASGGTPPPPSALIRNGRFPWRLAEAALRLVQALLEAQDPGDTAEDGTPPVPQPAASLQWQDRPPGQQWALACLPALSRLVRHAGKKAGYMLWDSYFDLQLAFQQVLGEALPPGLIIKDPRPPRSTQQQQQREQQEQPLAAPVVTAQTAAQPVASCVGGTGSVLVAAAPPLPQERPNEGGAAAPAASSIGAGAAAARRLQQQHVQVKQEPLSQAVGLAVQQPQQLPAAQQPARRSQQPPTAQQPAQQQQQQQQHSSEDTPFFKLANLPNHARVNLVGLLRRAPDVKVIRLKGDDVRVLHLYLRDHRNYCATVQIKESEGQLFKQVLAAARHHWAKMTNTSSPCILRVSNARLLGDPCLAAPRASGAGPSSSSGGDGRSCLLEHGSSVDWAPSGQQADKIRKAVAPGQKQQQQAGTQATVAFTGTQAPLSAHRPETQATPVMQWVQQHQVPQPHGTQVEEAGGRLHPVPELPLGSQGQQSQALPAAAAVTGRWKQLALDMLALLPRGITRNDAIIAMKDMAKEKDRWLAAGPQALAAEIARKLGLGMYA